MTQTMLLVCISMAIIYLIVDGVVKLNKLDEVPEYDPDKPIYEAPEEAPHYRSNIPLYTPPPFNAPYTTTGLGMKASVKVIGKGGHKIKATGKWKDIDAFSKEMTEQGHDVR
jgi:hypothetical protein